MARLFTYLKEKKHMKKYRFFALVALLLTTLLTNTNIKTWNLGAEEGPVVNNTIYLNLTKIGLLNDEPGTKIAEYYLEYGYELTLPIGSTLPQEEVSSTTNAVFVAWVIQSPSGGLQKITTMPSKANLILQAHFEKGSATSSEPDTSEPISSETSTSDIQSSEIQALPGLYLQAVNSSDFLPQYHLTENGYYGETQDKEYVVKGIEVTQGFKFFITNNNDFTGTGATTLPSYQSTNKPNQIGYSLSNGLTTNTTTYLQTSGVSESGVGTDLSWFKFVSPTPLGALEFKVGGTYDLYVVFYDNFGWAQIYVEPSI